jgi:chaperonin GroES
MNLKPLADKVVVERIEGIKTTASGIVLKTTEEPDRARVLAVGPDATELNVGDIVCLNWNAAVKTSDEVYVISEEHIVFVYGE